MMVVASLDVPPATFVFGNSENLGVQELQLVFLLML
jgi:hypothetical protein